MAVVDIVSKVSEKLAIEGEDYIINVSKKQLFKFYHKIKGLPPENVEREVKKFVTDKMKNRNEYFLKEVQDRNIEMLVKTIIDYFGDEIAYLSEEEVEDSTNVVKTYTYDEVAEDEDEDVEENNEVNNDDEEINL